MRSQNSLVDLFGRSNEFAWGDIVLDCRVLTSNRDDR